MARHPVPPTLALAALALATLASAPRASLAQAPTLVCVTPAGTKGGDPCRITMQASDSLQHTELTVRLTPAPGPARAGVRRPIVRWKATDGTLSADSVTPNDTGLASVIWYRPRGTKGAGVSAAVVTDAGSASRQFSLSMPTPTPPATFRLAVDGRGGYEDRRYGYEKTRLRNESVVQVLNGDSTEIDSLAVCLARRVVFRRVGASGSVTPDTAIPALINLEYRKRGQRRGTPPDSVKSVCRAYTNWTLGDATGLYDMRATLVAPDTVAPPVGRSALTAEFRAEARALPKFIAGFAFTQEREYRTRQAAPGVLTRFEIPLPGGGTRAFDSTVTDSTKRDTVGTAGGRRSASAVLGLALAPIPSFRWLTLVGGVSPTKPADNWFLGISALRATRLLGYLPWQWAKDNLDWATEHYVVDVHILRHYGQVAELKSPEKCASEGTCTTEDRQRYRGRSIMISVDASTLLSEAVKKVAGL